MGPDFGVVVNIEITEQCRWL